MLGALLAPFHFFFFPAFGVVALLYVVIGRRLLDADAPRNAALLLAPFILAVPFAVAPLLNASGSGALKFYLGWESAPLADGPAAVVFFYLTNLGVPFVLAIAALFVRDLKAKAFLGAWAVALFAIPNLMQVSDVAFDMNKYFQAMWIAVALLAAWFIRRWPWPAIALVLLLSVPSPLLVAGWTAFNREQVLDWNGVEAANWIAANTPDEAVFATDGWLNSPTDAAGRLRLITYTPYIANLGFDPTPRRGGAHHLLHRRHARHGGDDAAATGRPTSSTAADRPTAPRPPNSRRGRAAQGLRERRPADLAAERLLDCAAARHHVRIIPR